MTDLTVLGLLIGCGGIASLRLAWRRPGPAARALLACGWLALAWALYLCTLAWGMEFGISYGLAGFSLAALLLVGLNLEQRPTKPEKTGALQTIASSTSHKWLTFIAAGPLAAIASCQFTLVLAHALPGPQLNNMAIAAVGFPVLWGLGAYLTCLVHQPVKAALAYSITALACSAVLYLPGI